MFFKREHLSKITREEEILQRQKGRFKKEINDIKGS